MEPIVDFLAEVELKAAEQLVVRAFGAHSYGTRCRSASDRKDVLKARTAGKRERMAKLVKDLRAKAAKQDARRVFSMGRLIEQTAAR